MHANVGVIGAGPAGLMAAEVLAQSGCQVSVYDRMPSVGRKFLMAGKGGLNLTHSEPWSDFVTRYGSAMPALLPALQAFDAQALRDWAQGLGISTFVGSSGRVFPSEMKAAPLLRAWLHRLRGQGVRFHMRQRWVDWGPAGELVFDTPQGRATYAHDAWVLAMGGGSWPQLGSDAAWLTLFAEKNIACTSLQAANCGFDCVLSEYFTQRFAGQALKNIDLSFEDAQGQRHTRRGECTVSATGLEGSLIYVLSAPLRDTLRTQGNVSIFLDLLPHLTQEEVLSALLARGRKSWPQYLESRFKLKPIHSALVREVLSGDISHSALAATLKALPLVLTAPRPLQEAISTAGGVSFSEMDENSMLKTLPGIFCTGEMLDWEAPTGGYLLTACMATGRHAGAGVLRYLSERFK